VYLGSLGDGGLGGSGGSNGRRPLARATFESGDLSEWLGDGGGGTYTDGVTAAPIASRDAARTGQYGGAVSFHLAHTADGLDVPLYREQPSPPEAYYSAWFYLPATFRDRLLAEPAPLRLQPDGRRQQHRTGLGLSTSIQPRTGRSSHTSANRPPPPTGSRRIRSPFPWPTWVHFEIFYKKAPDATGRITIWQDGTQILDLPNVVTAPNAWTQWDIGGASTTTSPAATVYFDDAAISLTRLGPQG
jgi:hypothetical protein